MFWELSYTREQPDRWNGGLGAFRTERNTHDWIEASPTAVLASQEQPSFGQFSIPNRNLVVASTRSGPAGIVPPTVLLSDYEQLQKNFEELKQQNDELRMNNEENMRRL